jgi:GNAT superfamily N-acetyltransferase
MAAFEPDDLEAIGRLEESRIAAAFAELGEVAQPFDATDDGPGVMARGAPGLWVNAAAGFGMSGPIPRDRFHAMVEFYTSAGIEPRVELSPFVHPENLQHLEALGFGIRAFEFILYRKLGDAREQFAPVVPAPAGLTIEVVDPSNAELVHLWARVSCGAFLPPEKQPPPEFIALTEKCARHPRCTAVLARIDGEPAGGGGMEVWTHPDRRARLRHIATLWGVAVRPEFRRRGIQQALIAARLAMARDRGIQVVTIGSRPGVATERNVRRMGFAVAYTKVMMAKAGEGLVAVH